MTSTLGLSFLALLLLLGALEFAWLGAVRRRRLPWGEVGASLAIMVGRRLAQLAAAALTLPLFYWLWEHRLWQLPLDGVAAWTLAFLAVEFCYYWEHRLHHRVRWMWAAHRTHHSPNHFTILTTSRTAVTGLLSGAWIFFLPLPLLGIHPAAVYFLLLLNLTYQIWLHTELLPKLGPLEWLLNTPSHHRVHHAVNGPYLDRNFGGVLIVFDRLFGSFAAERAEEPCRYGLVKPERSHNPLAIVFREYGAILRDLRRARGLREAVGYLLGRPGWTPEDRPPPLPSGERPAPLS